ncbi:hypothetical protein ASPWEDRAFT_38801 [Aspergillus wentii DTO 134E9]|uniref:Zn(2)-C6 fungal-type domain-containing protein n=1 Tax=Aspergillus wentii DTO 134E9 TaxID=1073089 RepID=A0A1L9RQR0_ASPWE|nr:uncharacterized protein ASPWEDRAFT_38801 [Aspergillus wentii DTO 134E9]OJJ37147.1 hypothetical protein ASPWEDRAFT_38801 [Aspergillus wentii DTO 134E9]
MASVIEDHVFTPSDLNNSMELTDLEHSSDAQILQLQDQDIQPPDASVSESNVQEATSVDGGQTPTLDSPASDASRIKGNKKKKGTGLSGKSRRVRTGCLTCRERHLKCDEALHRCQNCRKSNRVCRRGLRLNFIDTQTATPPHALLCPPGTQLTFRDESRYIASEYVGGFERYPPLELVPHIIQEGPPQEGGPSIISSDPIPQPNSSATRSFVQAFEATQSDAIDIMLNSHSFSPFHPPFQEQPIPYAPFSLTKEVNLDSDGQSYFHDPEQVFLMQVFVDQVGIWMDLMDSMKHFTEILPFRALEEPMLLKALLACGARQFYHVNPAYGEEKASQFYEAASQDLFNNLQDPDRDSTLCATTAVALNVYETMCSRFLHGMNHIVGARVLIKECCWDAKTLGLGGACFWLNIGLELLSCLQFNWTLAWSPDSWGVDMDMDREQQHFAGDEEIWAHRMVYICAKISDFRSSISQFPILDHTTSEMLINQRYQEWEAYSRLCDQWAKAAPRSMMPLCYLHSWQTNSKSNFPEIWLIKRPAIVARLFYHTARLLLSKTYPLESEFSPSMRNMQQTQAHDICGIVAHVKDRGLASLSIRFLATAAECLATREAQEEALRILDNLIKKTGWPAEYIKEELQATWGWDISHQQHHALSSTTHIPAHPKNNPLMAYSDSSMENHPYQNYYVPPHHPIDHYQYGAF